MTSIINKPTTRPVVLCFSGHDPSGGAGIQADIEAIAAQGVHAATVITALTCQDTTRVVEFEAVNAQKMALQAETILADMSVAAIKIGMTADVEIVKAIHSILAKHPDIPVIFDPVLASGAGNALSTESLTSALNTYIVPHCQLLTPNIPEALKLTQTADIDKAAAQLLVTGVQQVLITGSHADSADIEHRLYRQQAATQRFRNSRLDGEYHGSGCTLASSIAAFIANGLATAQAVEKALDYSFKSLQHAHTLGKGQSIPDRLYQLPTHD